MRTVVAIFLLAASPAVSQERPAPAPADLSAVRDCLASSPETPDVCIGTIADPCQNEPDGASTVGISQCLVRESVVWDIVLNENYRSSLNAARAVDAGLGAAGLDPGAAESLRAAQRAWIAYRDAECGRLYALNQEGTIRSIIYADCERSMTARRALELAADPR